MERVDEIPATSTPPHRQPNFLSEMKVVLGSQARSVDNIAGEGVEGINCKKTLQVMN